MAGRDSASRAGKTQGGRSPALVARVAATIDLLLACFFRRSTARERRAALRFSASFPSARSESPRPAILNSSELNDGARFSPNIRAAAHGASPRKLRRS